MPSGTATGAATTLRSSSACVPLDHVHASIDPSIDACHRPARPGIRRIRMPHRNALRTGAARRPWTPRPALPSAAEVRRSGRRSGTTARWASVHREAPVPARACPRGPDDGRSRRRAGWCPCRAGAACAGRRWQPAAASCVHHGPGSRAGPRPSSDRLRARRRRTGRESGIACASCVEARRRRTRAPATRGATVRLPGMPMAAIAPPDCALNRSALGLSGFGECCTLGRGRFLLHRDAAERRSGAPRGRCRAARRRLSRSSRRRCR
jgi:hypothetical protein